MNRIFRIDFYPQDWLVKTGGLTPEQCGIYIQIIALIYASRGPIENDPVRISGLLRCSSRLARSLINQLLELKKIEIKDGFITNSRAESELNFKRTSLETSAKGGRNKRENGLENNKNNNLISSEAHVSLASTTPTPPRQVSKKERKVSNTLGVYTPEFFNFLNAYPKNNGTKKDAFEKFQSIINQGVNHEIIIAGAQRYAKFTLAEGTEQKYIRHAATWLNKRGWEVDYTASAQRINGNGYHQPTKYDRGKAAIMRAAERHGIAARPEGATASHDGDTQEILFHENLR